MRATVIYGAGDARIETAADPVVQRPTDALVRVVRACICGSDPWPYGAMPDRDTGERIGHEFLGIVEDVGSEVESFARGDPVVALFVWSDGTCDFCREGLQTFCRHGGLRARDGIDGGLFDRTVGLDGVPDGYRAMADRKSLKVLITP